MHKTIWSTRYRYARSNCIAAKPYIAIQSVGVLYIWYVHSSISCRFNRLRLGDQTLLDNINGNVNGVRDVGFVQKAGAVQLLKLALRASSSGVFLHM